jgi:hypothetical protein
MSKRVPSRVAWLLLIGGCGADASPQAIYDAANDRIHELHLDVFDADGFARSRYEAPCEYGGEVVMELEPATDGAVPPALYHRFERCAEDGLRFDGTVDYLDIAFCADGIQASYDVVGELGVDGHGACAFDVRVTCGVPAGRACGDEL